MDNQPHEPTPPEPSDTTARGAVPPTGGAPPEDAKPSASPHETASSAAEDLADGIDLLLRAARKTMRALDPQLEATAARALDQLRELDAATLSMAKQNIAAEAQQLETIAKTFGKNLTEAVQRIATSVDQVFGSSARPR